MQSGPHRLRVKEFAEQVSIFTLVKIGSDGFSLFLQAESLSGLNIIAPGKEPGQLHAGIFTRKMPVSEYLMKSPHQRKNVSVQPEPSGQNLTN